MGDATWDRRQGPGCIDFGAWLVSVPQAPVGRGFLDRH